MKVRRTVQVTGMMEAKGVMEMPEITRFSTKTESYKWLVFKVRGSSSATESTCDSMRMMLCEAAVNYLRRRRDVQLANRTLCGTVANATDAKHRADAIPYLCICCG